jgi:hypothetical protein
MKQQYDNYLDCPCCGNEMSCKSTDYINCMPCEIETVCFRCGWNDLWAYGSCQGISLGWYIEHKVAWKLNTGQVVL